MIFFEHVEGIEKAEQVHEAVPARFERPKVDNHGINLRVFQHRHLFKKCKTLYSRKSMFLKALFLVFSLVPQSFASPPPGLDWLTFSSAHFHVHHTKAQEPFARAFATELE